MEYSNEKTFTTWDGHIEDAEGNIYAGTQIGNQGWTAENLRSTKYNNGMPVSIGNGSNRTYWYGSGHAYVPNFDQDIDMDGDFDGQDSLLYVNEYGLLYSWFAAANVYDHTNDANLLNQKVYPSVRDICPFGWHLPTGREINDLQNFLISQHGPEEYAHHLTTTDGWADDMNGLDTYEFGLKPNAYWHDEITQHTNILKRVAFLWLAGEINEANGDNMTVDNYDKRISTSSVSKAHLAFCVRCIKDK